ncbi:MAG: hypothetical protein RI957_1293, partial [Verrucomicrobiota bacterium]
MVCDGLSVHLLGLVELGISGMKLGRDGTNECRAGAVSIV